MNLAHRFFLPIRYFMGVKKRKIIHKLFYREKIRNNFILFHRVDLLLI